jgi:hypothetical protein
LETLGASRAESKQYKICSSDNVDIWCLIDDGFDMHTVLDIDEDVLEAAKEIAARRDTTAGRVISDLVRSALAPRDKATSKRNGAPLLPRHKNGWLVSPALVNLLRDET